MKRSLKSEVVWFLFTFRVAVSIMAEYAYKRATGQLKLLPLVLAMSAGLMGCTADVVPCELNTSTVYTLRTDEGAGRSQTGTLLELSGLEVGECVESCRHEALELECEGEIISFHITSINEDGTYNVRIENSSGVAKVVLSQ